MEDKRTQEQEEKTYDVYTEGNVFKGMMNATLIELAVISLLLIVGYMLA